MRKHSTLLASEGKQRCPTPQSILSTKRLKLSTETSEERHSVAGALMFDGISFFCELVIEVFIILKNLLLNYGINLHLIVALMVVIHLLCRYLMNLL